MQDKAEQRWALLLDLLELLHHAKFATLAVIRLKPLLTAFSVCIPGHVLLRLLTPLICSSHRLSAGSTAVLAGHLILLTCFR